MHRLRLFGTWLAFAVCAQVRRMAFAHQKLIKGPLQHHAAAAAAAEHDSVTSCRDCIAGISAPSEVEYKSAKLMQVLVQVKAKGPPSEEDSSIAAQLMRLQDPKTGQMLADKYLLPQISVLFWAGFDTTGNTMAWTLFCISQHPEVVLQLST